METSLINAIKMMKDAEKVDIRGKAYATVATRLEIFRSNFGTDFGIITEATDTIDPNVVRVRAQIISTSTGAVIASGLAQEDRTASKINYTSSLEVAETSAIGRALACLGLFGSEYASVEEMVHALANSEKPPERPADKKTVEFRKEEPKQVEKERPKISQYKFYQPNSTHPDDMQGVYKQIDEIDDFDALTAYHKSLSDLMPHMMPEDKDELVTTFRDRWKQLKG